MGRVSNPRLRVPKQPGRRLISAGLHVPLAEGDASRTGTLSVGMSQPVFLPLN